MKYAVTLGERYHRSRWITDPVYPSHIQKSMEMVLVTEGRLKMSIKGQSYTVPAGSAVFVEPFDPHAYLSEEPNTCVVLEFSAELHEIFWKFLEDHTAENRQIALPPETMAYLLSQIPSETTLYGGRNTAQLQAILMPLCYAFLQGCEFTEATHDKHNDILLKALDVIIKTPPAELSLESVSRKLGIRPDSLSRIFVEQSDVTFHHYVQNLRVCKACALLGAGVPISETAYQAGFGSICSFNRVFKQIMRCTPREFLKKENQSGSFFDWEISPLSGSIAPCVNFVYHGKED